MLLKLEKWVDFVSDWDEVIGDVKVWMGSEGIVVMRDGIGLWAKVIGIWSIMVMVGSYVDMVVVGGETITIKGIIVETISETSEILVVGTKVVILGGGREKVVKKDIFEIKEGIDEKTLIILETTIETCIKVDLLVDSEVQYP